MTPRNRAKYTPSLADLLNLKMRETLLNLNCHAIATVESFDETDMTVQASLVYKRVILNTDANGTASESLQDYPLLVDCPAIIMQGGEGSLTFPISQGDTCLILFNDRDIDQWFFTGQTAQAPATDRLHSFSDGIALVGLRPATAPILDYDTTRASLNFGTTRVAVGPAGVLITADPTDTITLGTILNTLLSAIAASTTVAEIAAAAAAAEVELIGVLE